ncbi:nicotinate dehydrogenase subunit A [Pseudooceanicola antarcticus]|uniref:(2Fe-2S)-binding protein n=1 Tax=Pseudooceanicola antarcticus TaxID=1247613 RepID=A0A285JI95_9RHOB|nr:(2Fe-2S)-binding protein [Pseudooceanicola antarcticus]PJE26435.1 (2Fe-2S)-binding protein [Pseudooceanicola antarcticus]SNY59527.1 nicotinate dehydrogenase subunit A [Pseudooceanicola antarcticus]
MVQDELTLTLNGRAVTCRGTEGLSLLDLLREDLGLNGPKYGCGLAQCGACTVLVDGAPARACVLRAEKVAGRAVTTLEGLADPETGALHPLQQAFLTREGAQCGYCLNGMVMSARALLDRNPDPSEDEIHQALRHNLCRCGAHLEIVASVREAARLMRQGGDRT